jgi:hypothetical protein
VTGPDDDGATAGESESLISALNQVRVPLGNHNLIRKIIDGIGITSFWANVEASKPHVVATRSDGGLDLYIYYGYTTRFASEGEIVRILGPGVTRSPSTSPKGTWWVTHPVNSVYDGSERTKKTHREAGFCACGMQLSLAGACEYCE